MRLGISTARLTLMKHVALETTIVTIGILIALGFDGIQDWRRDREVVREAIGQIANEIRANTADLEETLRRLEQRAAGLKSTLEYVEDLIAHKEDPRTGDRPRGSINVLQFGLDLPAVAWSAAGSNGAIAKMTYSQVSRYATIYGLQAEFMRLVARMQDHYVAISVLGRIGLRNEGLEDLRRWRRELATAYEHTQLSSAIGKTLLGTFRTALAPQIP